MSATRRRREDRAKAGSAKEVIAGLPMNYVGSHWFTPACAEMMRHDPYSRGPIDRQLLRTMIGLDAPTAGYLYPERSTWHSSYRKGNRPVIEAIARGVAPANLNPETRVRASTRFVNQLRPRAEIPFDSVARKKRSSRGVRMGARTSPASRACASK